MRLRICADIWGSRLRGAGTLRDTSTASRSLLPQNQTGSWELGAGSGTLPCTGRYRSPLPAPFLTQMSRQALRSVNIAISGGQKSLASNSTVPIPRDTYKGAIVSRYHPATNRPLPEGVQAV